MTAFPTARRGPKGDKGDPGDPGEGVGNLFISDDPPVSPPAKYVWVQTGLGAGGTDMTIWVEDDAP